MSKVNVITDTMDSDFHCRLCVSRKLFLSDKANQLYRCPQCGSVYKYTKPSGKPKIGVDRELDNQGGTKVLFLEEESTKEKILPEVEGNIQVLNEVEINRTER